MEKENTTTPLIEAVKKNDIEEVRRLIEAGADVNEEVYFEEPLEIWQGLGCSKPSALMIALHNKNVELASLLIEHGADFNSYWYGNPNMLMDAICFNSKECAELLIKKGIDLYFIGTIDGDDCDALVCAAICNRKDIAEMLISYDTEKKFDYEGALQKAEDYDSKECAELLIKKGINLYSIGFIDGNYCDALVYAASCNRKDIAEMLISYDTEKKFDYEGALQKAEEYNSKDVKELLKKYGTYEKYVNFFWIEDRYLISCASNATSIVIPEGIDIANGAFKGCTKLQSITIPKDVTAFNIETFDNGTEDWELIDFSDCISLKEIFYGGTKAEWNFESGFAITGLFSMGVVIHCSDGDAEKVFHKDDIVIPDGVQFIASCLFFDDSLNSITIPESLNGIGTVSFKHCSIGTLKFNSSKLPEEVDDDSFRDCSIDCVEYPGTKEQWKNLYYHFLNYDYCDHDYPYPQPLVKCNDGEIHMEKGELLVYKIDGSVLKKGDSPSSEQYCEENEIEIPDTVDEIESWALNNEYLDYVSIPVSVKKIGEKAFNLCYTAVEYAGTMAQWGKIEKPENWYEYYKYYNHSTRISGWGGVVHCSDGIIELPIPNQEE